MHGGHKTDFLFVQVPPNRLRMKQRTSTSMFDKDDQLVRFAGSAAADVWATESESAACNAQSSCPELSPEMRFERFEQIRIGAESLPIGDADFPLKHRTHQFHLCFTLQDN
jgi:hypothetical protein